MAPVTRSMARKALSEANQPSPTKITKKPSKVSKKSEALIRKLVLRPLVIPQSSRCVSPELVTHTIVLPLNPHMDLPELSPSSRLTKNNELRQILCGDCLRCLNTVNGPPSSAAEDLWDLSEAHDDAVDRVSLLKAQLEHYKAILSVVHQDIADGSDGPQILEEVRAYVDNLKRDYQEWAAEFIVLDDMMEDERREWSKLYDGSFAR